MPCISTNHMTKAYLMLINYHDCAIQVMNGEKNTRFSVHLE
jgi:hypothetical protein